MNDLKLEGAKTVKTGNAFWNGVLGVATAAWCLNWCSPRRVYRQVYYNSGGRVVQYIPTLATNLEPLPCIFLPSVPIGDEIER